MSVSVRGRVLARALLVIAGTLLSLSVLAGGLWWIVSVENPFVGVAPDLITPFVLMPVVAAITGAWAAVVASIHRSTRIRRRLWRFLFLAAVIVFMGGATPFACRVWDAGRSRIDEHLLRMPQLALAAAIYGSAGGAIALDIAAIPTTAIALILRRRRA